MEPVRKLAPVIVSDVPVPRRSPLSGFSETIEWSLDGVGEDDRRSSGVLYTLKTST